MADAEPDKTKDRAKDREKDRALVRVLPPVVPLATVVAGFALDLAWPAGFGFAPPDWLRYGAGGALLALALLGLVGWAAWLMKRQGQDPNPYTPTPGLILAGPYRLTRNPMYLAMVIACLAFAILLWNPWIVALTPLCALALHHGAILPEEAYLERKFGEDYRAYKARTRRWV